eukprot:TRINITY_DN12302_c0_g1_i7.p1 TRINITY_DN12302_c0_g1~~TRINITY_DN12302_c0_g1_i7.p1  ORF type:complete len:550 (+),score=108.30 TRINITY_DN12302_c0_g1_i7:67-1650(+)
MPRFPGDQHRGTPNDAIAMTEYSVPDGESRRDTSSEYLVPVSQRNSTVYSTPADAAAAAPSANSNIYKTPSEAEVPWFDDTYAAGPSQAVMDLYSVPDKTGKTGPGESSTDFYATPTKDIPPHVTLRRPADHRASGMPEPVGFDPDDEYAEVGEDSDPHVGYNGDVYDQPTAVREELQAQDPHVGFNGDLYDQPSTVDKEAEAQANPAVGYNGDLYDQPSTVIAEGFSVYEELEDQDAGAVSGDAAQSQYAEPVGTAVPVMSAETQYATVDDDADKAVTKPARRPTLQAPSEKVDHLPGFHGGISRSETNGLLKRKPQGTYLLRTSDKSHGFVLSIVGLHRVEHHVIRRETNGTFYIHETPFPSEIASADAALERLQSDTMGVMSVELGNPLGSTAAAESASTRRRQRTFDDNADKGDESAWLHPEISRSDAEQLVVFNGAKEGQFLVRRRKGMQSYAIACLFNGRVSHHLLQKDTSTGWLLNDLALPEPCTSLASVVALLRVKKGPKLPGILTHPVAPALTSDAIQ